MLLYRMSVVASAAQVCMTSLKGRHVGQPLWNMQESHSSSVNPYEEGGGPRLQPLHALSPVIQRPLEVMIKSATPICGLKQL